MRGLPTRDNQGAGKTNKLCSVKFPAERGAMIEPLSVPNMMIVDPIEQDLQNVRRATGQIVGSVFYGSMFRSMRESPFKSSLVDGGRGEEVFAAQLHEQLAERLGERTGQDLGDALYQRLEHQQRLMTSRRIREVQESTSITSEGQR